MMSPQTLAAFSAELEKIGQEGGFVDAFKAPFVEAGRLVNPNTARQAWGDLWRGSANTHELNRAALAEELAKQNTGLTAGKYVDNLTHAQGLRASLRRGGWLANYGKYEGPSVLKQGLNTVARHLPGQRTLLLGGAAMQARSDLARRDPLTGRERGAAERGLGTAGGLLGTAAGSAPAAVRAITRGGIPGAIGGLIGGAVVGGVSSATGKFLGRKIDQMRGFKPTEQPPQVQG